MEVFGEVEPALGATKGARHLGEAKTQGSQMACFAEAHIIMIDKRRGNDSLEVLVTMVSALKDLKETRDFQTPHLPECRTPRGFLFWRPLERKLLTARGGRRFSKRLSSKNLRILGRKPSKASHSFQIAFEDQQGENTCYLLNLIREE